MKTKEATYTPGPWKMGAGRTSGTDWTGIYNESATSRTGEPISGLAQVYEMPKADPDFNETDWEETKANARLIASAPEMLEALIETRDLMSRLGSPTMDGYAKVDAAIAKATGKEEGR